MAPEEREGKRRMTKKEVHEIQQNNRALTQKYIMDFDSRWEEIQRIFKNCNDDLSRIPIVPEHVEYKNVRL